jgi:hypothetical protein
VSRGFKGYERHAAVFVGAVQPKQNCWYMTLSVRETIMLHKTALLACTSIFAVFGFEGAATAQEGYSLTKRISIKPIQVEYVMTQFDSARLGGATRGFGSHQNDVRYSTGVVFRFGEK